MGQKVNPISLRLQITKDWRSRWFASRRRVYADWLEQDLKARRYISQKLGLHGAVNKVTIERPDDGSVTVNIYTARVGVVIGRGGSGANQLSLALQKIYQTPAVRVNIEEIKRPEMFAQLVACNIASQIERRFRFRRIIKNAAAETMAAGAEGIRIEVAGRLDGAEMSRREREVKGAVPRHKLRAQIDYGAARAYYPGAGIVGVKVWINKGEVPVSLKSGQTKSKING